MDVYAVPGDAVTNGPPYILQNGTELELVFNELGTYTIVLTNVTSSIKGSITNFTATSRRGDINFGIITYTGPGQGSIVITKDGNSYETIQVLGYTPAPAPPIISNSKNSSVKGGMPAKFGSADGSTSFNNARKSFTKSVLRSETYKEPTKTAYGNSDRKDASGIIADKKKNAIGASVNHLQQEIAFGAKTPVESTTAKKALSRGSRYRF